jgi:hypothetical protein
MAIIWIVAPEVKRRENICFKMLADHNLHGSNIEHIDQVVKEKAGARCFGLCFGRGIGRVGFMHVARTIGDAGVGL